MLVGDKWMGDSTAAWLMVGWGWMLVAILRCLKKCGS